MGSEWQEVSLSNVVELIGGGTPKRKVPEYWGGSIPWLSVKDFNDDLRHVEEAEEFITDLGLKESSTKMLFAGQLIISARGTVGALAQLSRPMAFNQSCYGINGKPEYAINDFLYYLIKDSLANIKQITHGAVFDTITRETFKHIIVKLPPLPEQRAIAHILGTLDDKIEWNRKMNETLEAMARAIFKSWFVDFDPVRAKMKGRAPGLPKEVADLFPDSFEDSELGEIPKGWKVSTLKDVVTIHDSKRIPLSGRERKQRSGPYPYYGAASIMDYIDNYIFDGVYVLMGEDGSVIDEKDHPVIQYVWGKFWTNNHAHVLQGANNISTDHIMLFLRQVNIRPYATGAVQPKVNQKNMKSIPFVMPLPQISGKLDEFVDSLFARYRDNVEQSRTLSVIRDTLLPKLISGELRLKDAERFVARCGI